MKVMKADGRMESFSEYKLRKSMRKAMAGWSDQIDVERIEQIIKKIREELYDGMRTGDIRVIILENLTSKSLGEWMNFDIKFKKAQIENLNLPQQGWPDDILQLSEEAMSGPVIDLRETEISLLLTAKLPSMKKEDINIEVEEECVRIGATRRRNDNLVGEDFYEYSRKISNFYREIALTQRVMPENATARYTKGILRVEMPKLSEGKKKKRLKIT